MIASRLLSFPDFICSFACRLASIGFALASVGGVAESAVKTTPNFQVTAESSDMAAKVARRAEECRCKIAEDWLGKELSAWRFRCSIVVEERATGGSGWISYPEPGETKHGMQIRVRGQISEILETYLPHEITHAVLMTARDTPLPRWVDEGIAMMSESGAERRRFRKMAGELAANGKLPTTDKILTLCVYPADRTELTAYYAASFLLTQFLEERGGRPQLFEFVADAERDGWEIAARKRYRFADLQDLDSAWRRWLTQSSSEHVAAVSDSGG